MKLSDRLQSIADFVQANSIVADIGTDHGYIPAYLINNKISKYVIATDISQGSLNKAKELNLDGICTRLGNGLQVLKPFEVDTVIIAGMGGLLIRDILLKNIALTNSFTHFIFQPMVASKELREFLIGNNFVIIDEDLVREDNKYYEIIYAKIGKGFVEKEINYEISNILIKKKHSLLKEFIDFKIQSIEKIILAIDDIETEKSKDRLNELSTLIGEYKEVLAEIES